jgi:arylsulfatase A-like enzyme
MRARSLAVLFLLVLAGVAAHWAATRSASKRPNILLISIDSMRRDRSSAYGYRRQTTPALERLAADGIRFDRTYNNGGFTLRSHMTLMTSLRPDVHGVVESSGLALADDRTTLAEVLSREGYRTGGFVDGGWMAGGFGFARGFDLYDDAGGGLATTIPKAMEWLTEGREHPSFLFLHTYDAHSGFKTWPYECPSEFLFRYVPQHDALGCKDGRCASDLITWIDEEVEAGRLVAGQYLSAPEQRSISAMYDGCLGYVDHKLGELFDWLRTRSLYDETLIVVLSDHGEEFLEHGMLGHNQEGYEETVGIPLIVKLPAQSQRGRRVGSLTAMVDVMPTVLEIVGLAAPATSQGVSLVPTFDRDVMLRKAVRSGDTLITPGWKLLADRNELLPIPSTPQWQENQYARQPDRVATLKRMLAVMIGEDAAAAARLNNASKHASPIDGLLRERLRSLGYLGR